MHSNCSLNNESDYNEEDDLFYFESEHLALRGNKDYSELLKTIAILEAQRAVAVKDIDTIIEIQNSALDDPVAFIEKIKNKEDLGIPCPQRIVELPLIDWSKYDVPIPEEAFRLINQEKIEDNHINKEPKKPKLGNQTETFNKSWTSEEQKKLEELLIQFPPEPIEMRRYKKIAEALGNRTVKQVTSRVQKYFLKLFKAGLPIPGRIPKINDRKKTYVHKHQRHNVYLYKPSTFFPDLEVPVFMTENDDEDVVGTSCSTQIASTEIKEKSDLEIKISLLKKIKIEKEKDDSGIVHIGFKCDKCNEEPVLGVRWHCFDCSPDSIDFCTDCMVAQLQNKDGHPIRHNLQPIRNSDLTKIKMEDSSESSDEDDQNSNLYDQDYINSNIMYNYLDPNFLPQ